MLALFAKKSMTDPSGLFVFTSGFLLTCHLASRLSVISRLIT